MFAKKSKNNETFAYFDQDRSNKYKILDMQKELPDPTLLTRNSQFKYTEKNGKREYNIKTSEVRIEKYKSENDEGSKFGIVPINLAEFIGLGIKYVTLKLADG